MSSLYCCRTVFKVNGHASSVIGRAGVAARTKETHRRTGGRLYSQCARRVQSFCMGRSDFWPTWYFVRRRLLQSELCFVTEQKFYVMKLSVTKGNFTFRFALGAHVVSLWIPLFATNFSLPDENVAS